MKKNTNPLVQEVIEKFDTVYTMTKSFVENRHSALKGLLISGDAGTGKTHFVKKAFIDTETTDDVKYVKGASISAASLYVMLYMYKEEGKVVVLDDVDITSKSPAERNAILDMMKGATEVTKGDRNISWIKAQSNPLMVQNNVPTTFNFEGSLIWITNETIDDIAKKAKNHWGAISSRFNQVKVYLTPEQKLMYTLFLIEDINMLGKECEGKEGGYSIKVQNDTIDYIKDNWKDLFEITPRLAIKIADIRNNHPSNWKVLIKNQL